ncbi:MAG TPA: tyrosine-protein phosphatase [Rhizomicrobium sp.]|jgi:protein tyrosine/serine phosphatase|nr:tyrosine-protein phosphatase [Rhizomicrobium sp.]
MRTGTPLSFAGIENFRDFGGFVGQHGRVREGFLFRSGHHANATDEDLASLSDLSLATIADLRRPAERADQPSRRPPDFRGAVLVSDLGDRAKGPHREFLEQGDLSDAAIMRYLFAFYRAAPFDLAHRELFAGAFVALRNGPLLIHCTQGKDRTGLLAALIQHALGAHPDTIREEFLQTNQAMLTQERIAHVTAGLAMTGHAASPVAIRALLGVGADHLEASFDAIRDEVGSLDAYLDRLGVHHPELLMSAYA